MKMHSTTLSFVAFRRRTLWLLTIPVFLAVAAFAIAVAQISQEADPAALAGAWRMTGMASAIYLIFAFLYAPSYVIGLVWFFFSSKAHAISLRQGLMLMPVISACFAWFPVMLVSTLSMSDRLLAFGALAPVALIGGWLWSFIVHQATTWSFRTR
ncbi:hypothetical protein [Castellaniella sp.]|uniref:hypothetical protein n=1 Tax=Castellaniella sp. TaxID=1955812 RepID=UPI002AFDFE3E|nr:hypothetical protein [Castellaniella sp.]